MLQSSLQFIVPEIILTVFAAIVLLVGVFERFKSFTGVIALTGIVLSLFLLPGRTDNDAFLFSGMLINDGFALIFRQILLLISGIIILISMACKNLPDEDISEYYFFLLAITVAMLIAVASNNLMMIYITLESVSIISYIMAGFLKRDVFSSEAGVKYFLFGSLSTGITLYGISLMYGLFGTLDLAVMVDMVAAGGVNQIALVVSLILVLVGFAFKCSLAPFHMWTPDVYEGAPTPVAAFFSVAPKAVGFAFILRIFVVNFQSDFVYWTPLAGFIAVLTMTIGNLIALKQENIKRLLAYSTIAQAGYIFVGLAVGTPEGIKASLFYIFIYTIMNLGAFGAVIVIANTTKTSRIADFAGMYKNSPLIASVLAVSFLSLAGIPPLAGFFAKFFILAAAVEADLTILALAVVLNSIIALYYYVKVIKLMFLNESQPMNVVHPSMSVQLMLTILLIANLFLGVWPHPVLNWLTQLLHLV